MKSSTGATEAVAGGEADMVNEIEGEWKVMTTAHRSATDMRKEIVRSAVYERHLFIDSSL
jgi:hypothetical protein